MPPVNRSTATSMALVRDPVYQQLNELLRGLIRSGECKAGEQFLTERVVAERFGVSRVTANKALSSLVSEGVLEFRKGVGTFVRELGMDYDLRSLMSFSRKAELSGKIPETEVRAFSTTAAKLCGDPVIDTLGLDAKDLLHYVERLRLADGVPLILERRFIVARHCPHLRRNQLAGSLYSLFTDVFGLHLSGVDQTVRARGLSTADARVLKVPNGSAALWVHATGFCQHGPLWLEDTLYRGDLYEFHNALGSDKAQRPARSALSPAGAQHIIREPKGRRTSHP